MLNIALDFYRKFYRPYWPRHLLALALVVATVPLYILLALLMERVAQGSEPLTNGLALIGVALAILLLEVGLDVWLLAWTLVAPQRGVQRGVLSRFLQMPPRLYGETASGDLSAAAIQYMHGTWYLRDALRLFHALVTVLILALIIARISWLLAAAATLPVLFLGGTLHLVKRRWVPIYTQEREARSRLETFIIDTLRGVLTVKLYGAERFHTTHLTQLAQAHNWHWFRSRFLFTGISTLLSNLGQFAIPLFLLVGGYLISRDVMTGAQLVALYVIFNILNHHTFGANYIVSYVLTDLGQLKQIQTFLQGEREGERPFPFQVGQVVYEDVTFTYRQRPILHNFSLTIQPGEKVAIVGPSGTGKSTLLALLLGIQFPQQGQVCVDGVPVSQQNAPSLRQQIAAVSQAAYLFDADLAFNLTFGYPRRAAEIEQALRVVGLEEFVAALPDGLQTRFGSGGFTISGGEKARLCLARALLLARPILLLDEVTAHVDSIREEEILRQVLHQMADKSVVVISHRLSSIRDFPRIVLLENGRIRGEGTHQELLVHSPRYRALFGEQV